MISIRLLNPVYPLDARECMCCVIRYECLARHMSVYVHVHVHVLCD